MLVLTRKKGQSIVINDNIEITFLEIDGGQIRVGINAPKDVSILRKEVYTEIKEENQIAIKSDKFDLKNLMGVFENNRNKLEKGDKAT